MLEQFSALHPILQALLATCFTWLMTALGAAVVFWRRDISRKVLDWMLGFAAGVMIAASFWSLLAPAIALSEDNGTPGWLPAAVGFLTGGIVLRLIDRILPHLHLGLPVSEAEGVKTGWKRSTLLVLAITLHDIPAGLAVGVAVGAAAAGVPYTANSRPQVQATRLRKQ
jgi:ZIP family zinc transporter